MKITVVGLGYVGLSLSVLLSQKFNVYALDIDKQKIDKLNKRLSPVKDSEISSYLKKKNLHLTASLDKEECYRGSNYIIIATPTDYDRNTNKFNTKIVKKVINEAINIEPNATIVIKSTVPFGFTEHIKSKLKNNNIFFSPEFLRESKALYDNLYPSRIIIGDNTEKAKKFGIMLKDCSLGKDIKILNMNSNEAEATKLFSNTFLAMRISFFNELDSFCEVNRLNPKSIIDGVCLDNRIGNFYNNPSFGYGGYCLPKDTQQLLNNYKKIPNSIVSGVVESNKIRKEFITNSILKKHPTTVGIYRLTMKTGSDNFRESAVVEIMNSLIQNKVKVIIYEPFIENNTFENITCYSSLEKFIEDSDMIIANRMSKEIEHIKNKIYTRDIFGEN
mgnify:CR=1 FL=1|tara:strand:+ start:799 stop:1965 length:1167 start_codon:yes stop_codon:yes gene_type:complete